MLCDGLLTIHSPPLSQALFATSPPPPASPRPSLPTVVGQELAPDLVIKFFDPVTKTVRLKRRFTVIEVSSRMSWRTQRTVVESSTKYHNGPGGIDPALQPTYALRCRPAICMCVCVSVHVCVHARVPVCACVRVHARAGGCAWCPSNGMHILYGWGLRGWWGGGLCDGVGGCGCRCGGLGGAAAVLAT